MASYTIQVEGLKELNKALGKIGVPDDAIKDAMHDAGVLIQREAFRLMPFDTGKMAKTLKVNRAKNLVKVSVGNNTTVRYAYTFHAVAMGKSKGGFTYHVKSHYNKRGGKKYAVSGYTAKRYIPNNPFLFKAAERKAADVFAAYTAAIDKLIKQASRG